MTQDYRITTAGKVVAGRDAFKKWVAEMQTTIGNATNEHLDVFANERGDGVVSRWICRGTNKGMFGLPADGAPVSFFRHRHLARARWPISGMLGRAQRLRAVQRTQDIRDETLPVKASP